MKITFTVILLFFIKAALAQNPAVATLPRVLLPHAQHKFVAGKDTTIESDTTKENKEPRYYYASYNADFFVNTKGGLARRFSPAIELGRTYGIFDIGLATGSWGSDRSQADTARYLEFRPTINVFSSGRFAEGLCLGAGYIFGAKQGLITEICNSINFNISVNVAVAVTQGYVFFDGTNSNRSAQYMGLSLTYNFLRPHSVNKQRKKEAIIKN